MCVSLFFMSLGGEGMTIMASCVRAIGDKTKHTPKSHAKRWSNGVVWSQHHLNTSEPDVSIGRPIRKVTKPSTSIITPRSLCERHFMDTCDLLLCPRVFVSCPKPAPAVRVVIFSKSLRYGRVIRRKSRQLEGNEQAWLQCAASNEEARGE